MTDSLYGQKELSEFCEFVIASLFEVAPSSPSRTHRPAFGREGIDTPPYTPPLDGQPRKEPPVLVEFIAYALYRTRLPIAIVHQSLLLLSRLKQRYPSARGTASSPHRLFLSSLMLSAKISMDDTYSNKSWTIVGSNYFALKEVNQMERELFAFLGWNVVVAKEELDEFVASAQNSYTQARLQQQQQQQQQKQALQAVESTKRRRPHHEQEESAREARHQQARNAARALLRPHTYRHQSPSPIRSNCNSATASPSMSCSSASSSPYLSRTHSPTSHASIASHPYHVSSSSSHRQPAQHYPSCSSSATSSTFPSATHSPTSPASAPLSAGPQTPESEHTDVHPHINVSPDFPEAATYVTKSVKSSHSPALRRTTRQHAVVAVSA